MRILGFSIKWPKLEQPEFTTFRFTRRDRDWQVGELVQIVYKPRSKEREILGIAEIIKKDSRKVFKIRKLYHTPLLTSAEARRDGFNGWADMALWLSKARGNRVHEEPMNKLTLRWVKGDSDVGK